MESVMESIHAKGRDNARTPMQWHDGENAGFTSGEPWIKVNPNYTEINVANQEQDENSVLNYYRHLVALRKREQVILDGEYSEIFPEREDIVAYARDNGENRLTVVCNFTGDTVEFPTDGFADCGKLEISNYADAPSGNVLRPYEAVMYLK